MHDNPYDSTSASRTPPADLGWQFWLQRFYWLCWISGTVMILTSWVDVISPGIGWIGFAIAGGASALSYLTSSAVPSAPSHDWETASKDWAVLTSRMLVAKDSGYHTAIARFREGAVMLYEGHGFAFRPHDEIGCAAILSVPRQQLSDHTVRQDVQEAKRLYDGLRHSSPEFAALVQGKTLRVSIMSEFGMQAVELCRVVNDDITWMAARP